MIRTYLSAIFATASSAVFILTVACPVKDPILCSILHPVNYFMVILLMTASVALLMNKPLL